MVTVLILCLCYASYSYANVDFFTSNFGSYGSEYESQFGPFSEKERLKMMDEAKRMFYHGYDNYMKHAFPADELNPLFCKGRGPDYENP